VDDERNKIGIPNVTDEPYRFETKVLTDGDGFRAELWFTAMNDDLRGKCVFHKVGDYRIVSAAVPSVIMNDIYLPGDDWGYDNRFLKFTDPACFSLVVSALITFRKQWMDEYAKKQANEKAVDIPTELAKATVEAITAYCELRKKDIKRAEAVIAEMERLKREMPEDISTRFTAEKGQDVWNIVNDIYIGVASCQYCIMQQDCGSCDYGKEHGKCLSCDSDYMKVENAREALKNAISKAYPRN
jgi:hypothetical protein